MTDQAMAASTVRVCRNVRCRYVGNPDPRELRYVEERCPKCGMPWSARPTYKGPDEEE